MRHLSCVLGLVVSLQAQDAAVDFVREVAPILQQRCVSCHGADKQKGDLRLDMRAHAMPAEDGSIVAGKPDDSELLRRIALPDGDEERMPNEGERLPKAEAELLTRWIQGGAVWPEAGDAWFVAEREKRVIPKIDFGIADPDAAARSRIDAAVRALREKGVICDRIASDTPAMDLNASLAGAAFTDADLRWVADLAPVLVWANLGRTAVTDQGMTTIAAMPQLRRLSVANTSVGDAGLSALGSLPQLESLNLYASKATDQGLLAMTTQPRLRKVFAFSTAISADGSQKAIAKAPSLVVDRGEYAAQRMAAAEKEIAERKRREEPANVACIVTGEKPSPEHFLDADGMRLVFCCAKCKKKYQDAPQEFAAKVDELRKQRAAAETKGEQSK